MIEGDRVRQVAANAAAHVATDLQAKLAAAQAEYGFKLGVALEALRHVGHVLRGGFRAPEVAVAHQFLMLLAKLLPAFDEPVGALERVDADFRRSEEHTSELPSLMRISYAVFCLKKKNKQ